MPRRCAFLTPSGRPCPKTGTGNPPLCAHHQEELEAEVEDGDEYTAEDLFGDVLEHPGFRSIFDRIAGSIDKVARGIDSMQDPRMWQNVGKAYQAKQEARSQGNESQGRSRRPPPPPETPDPRSVLGFPPSVKITAEMVKDRRKELAKLFHPDKGGSHEAMQRVNAAAEKLLRDLK